MGASAGVLPRRHAVDRGAAPPGTACHDCGKPAVRAWELTWPRQAIATCDGACRGIVLRGERFALRFAGLSNRVARDGGAPEFAVVARDVWALNSWHAMDNNPSRLMCIANR